MNMQRKIALIGFGTVGQAFYEQVRHVPGIRLSDIIVRDSHKPRRPEVVGLVSTHLDKVLDDPYTQIIVEAIDDPEAALLFARKALMAGKTYISANKRMLATHLPAIISRLSTPGARLYYEAAVGGAIPVMRLLKEYYRQEEIMSLRGIVNGSTNYILTRMHREKLSFSAALQMATEQGYAESDPTLDITGYDAVYKSVLLAYEAFGVIVKPEQVQRQGIAEVTSRQVALAVRENKKIKLVSSIFKEGGQISISVKLATLADDDPLFAIDGVMNGIVITGARSGDIMLQGAGAGGHPTASAMIADLKKASELRYPVFAPEEQFRFN
jgi:homoserine dehydrogenase